MSVMQIEVPLGYAKDYDALSIILQDDLDIWEQFGIDIITSIEFWLDRTADCLSADDFPKFEEMLLKKVKYGKQWRESGNG